MSRLGCKHSEETRRKISESTKGRVPWNKGLLGGVTSGVPRSDEVKKKIS